MNIIMPQLGETVAEGTVTKWHKKVGDTIKADEALFDRSEEHTSESSHSQQSRMPSSA